MDDQRRMYGDLAWTWNIISRPENYVEEAGQFHRLIQEHARIEVRTLLDLGCGGGHNDFHLQEHYQVTGVDLSEPMLALARRLNPQVRYIVGDMRTVRLEETFDAVIAADAIGYMRSEEELRAAFRTAFRHLRPGGVFCTYAEEIRERFQQNGTTCWTRRQGDVEVVLVQNLYDPDPADTSYEMTFIYLIRRGGRLEIETDRHLGGLFALATWRRLLDEVGFEVRPVEPLEDEAPAFVGIKPM